MKIQAYGKVFEAYELHPTRGYGCDMCCNGDRCDNPKHRHRSECPYCKGKGWIPESEATLIKEETK